jgi:hypothetical protein
MQRSVIRFVLLASAVVLRSVVCPSIDRSVASLLCVSLTHAGGEHPMQPEAGLPLPVSRAFTQAMRFVADD